MNEQSYFHWDLFRPPIHSPSFAMGPSFFDIREEAIRGMPNKTKAFTFDQSCALWSKDIVLDPSDGLQNVGGRVLEIRKEKSRDAARSRRGKENYEFYELAKLLPLPAAITSQLDKASIIRLSISYLKLRDFCGHGDPPWHRDGGTTPKTIKGGHRRRSGTGVAGELFELHQGAHILQSLDGFAFALSTDGKFLYISETVSIYLGLSQVEMAGSSIFDYVHTQDHQELADQLGLALAGISSTMSTPASPTTEDPTSPRAITPIPERVPMMAPNLDKGLVRTFCIRMKSTLTKRGVHTRASGYRVVLIVGQFRHQFNFGLGRKGTPPLLGMTCVAIALPPPTITELRIEADTFIMRLTTEFKVIYCENMISNLMDWKCEEVSGRDLYRFCHPGDIHHLKKIHCDLLMKGQVLSPSIRILNKGGGYIWVQVCATSLYNSKTSDDQTILAIFQTISSIEHRGLVMDVSQQDGATLPEVVPDKEKAMAPNEVMPPLPTPEMPVNTVSRNSSPTKHTEDTPSIFPDNVENDFLLEDQSGGDLAKPDNKSSRRKTERPRKRKRDSGDDILSVDATDIDLPDTQSIHTENKKTELLNLDSGRTSRPTSPKSDRAAIVTSPQLPEDLSFRAIVDKDDLQSCDGKSSNTLTGNGDLMSNSVKELEKAMNRHLPSRQNAYNAACTDDTRHMCESQIAKSTNLWSSSNSVSISDEPLMASAFLRHLYTNRDTVIRSNGRPTCFNGDVNALNMLTPPNTNTCKDQLHLNIPHITVQSKGHATVFKDTVSAAEDFSMTPPSSVSPQDKMSPFSDNESECLSSRLGHGSQMHPSEPKLPTFPSVLQHDGDFSKSPHISAMHGYSYNGLDMSPFSHCSGPGGSAIFDTRPQTGHGLWFG